jgi:hypothetical protein
MSAHAAIFLCAAALLFIAHAIRAIRWNMLLPPEYVARRYSLLMGLAIGYLCNTFLPLRMGEVLRVAWVSDRERVRFAYVAASVAAERLADVAAVALIAAAITFFSGWRHDLSHLAQALAAIGMLVVIAALAVRRIANARYALWRLFSIFNPALRLGFIDFAWSFSELVTSRALLRLRFLWVSFSMWCCYLLSYYLLSYSIDSDFDATLQALLGSPLRPTWDGQNTILSPEGMALMLFTGLPIVGILVYGILNQWPGMVSTLISRLRDRNMPLLATPSARQKFKSEHEFDTFLTSLFAGERQVVRQFGLLGVDDAVVHKLFHGGSDAVTALVESGDRLVIRKFADGAAGSKLRVQCSWLAAHSKGALPLVDILVAKEGNGYFQYDMPLVIRANDFYDLIHTADLQTSRRILAEVLRRLALFHQQNAGGDATPQLIRDYLEQKAVKNARQILSFARSAFPYRDYEINGLACSMDEWEKLTDIDWLMAQVSSRNVSVIHGDLTIENIIAAPDFEANFYLIDPNPENIFDSPLIDYAKLMQSLHLGYESLNRGRCATIDGKRIHLAFTRSHQYSELHDYFERFVIGKWGADVLREIYFHEIVNYLRLTPYKIRQNPEHAGITFFAGTSYLLRRYLAERAS